MATCEHAACISIVVAVLATPPRTRTTRLARQVTTATATVAGEYLAEDADLTITVEIDARRSAGEVLAACKVGELVVVTGRVSQQCWINRRGCPGEKWTIAAKQVERVKPGSDAAIALGLDPPSTMKRFITVPVDSPVASHGRP